MKFSARLATAACLEETDTGLLWPDTTRNNAAVLPCTMAGSRFRKGESPHTVTYTAVSLVCA